MRLDSISEVLQIAGNNQFFNTYKFEYNKTPLPLKDGFAVDYWGYYNGKNDNLSSIPNFNYLLWGKITSLNENSNGSLDNTAYGLATYSNFGIYSANRASNFTFAQAGILETIIYPTKGKLHYTYEPNTFYGDFLPDATNLKTFTKYDGMKYHTTNRGCGIRVKQIDFQENSDINNLITTQYFYDDPITNESSGLLHSSILFNNACVTLDGHCMMGSPSTSIQVTEVLRGNNILNNPYAYVSGVGYGIVTETRVNGGKNNGKTVSYFHNYEDIKNNRYPKSLPFSNPLNGKIEFKDYYDSTSNKVKYEDWYYITEEQKFLWGATIERHINRFPKMHEFWNPLTFSCISYGNSESFYLDDYTDANGKISNNYIGTPFYAGQFTITKYQIPCYSVMLKSKNTYMDGILTSEDYEYNPTTLQLKKIIKDSPIDNENALTHTYKYANDYNVGTYPDMASKNMLNKVVEEKIYKNNKLIYGSFTDYIKTGNNNYLPSKRYYSELSAPLNDTGITSDGIPNTAIYPRANVIFSNYDALGNLVSATENDATEVVYLWGYNKQHAIAEIKGSTYAKVTSAFGGAIPDFGAGGLTPDQETILRALLLSNHLYLPALSGYAHHDRPTRGSNKI